MVRVTFVMEQHIGHYTYYTNLRRFIDPAPEVEATWVPVTYTQAGGLWERLTVLPSGVRGSMRGRAQVRNGISRDPGDVLFFNTQVPAALAGGMLRRRPYLVSTDLTPLQYDELAAGYGHKADRPGPLSSYKRMVNTRVFRGAARLVPWSNWVRESLIKDYGVEPSKIDVLPPGVDLSQWHPSAHDDEGPLRILFVGGDLHRKGGELLLRAFRELPRGSAELYLVTRTRITPEEGVVTYHDLQPNAPELVALYQRCHVFVLPTGAEAFGIAAVEASASSLPVIATRVGGLPDIVADGETGLLIRPGDTQGLVSALHRLSEDVSLRQRMGAAARERVERLFDARRNAERLIGYLREAAGQ